MTIFYHITIFTVAYCVTAYIAYFIGKIRGEEKSVKVAKDYYEKLFHAETENSFKKTFEAGYKKGFADGEQQGYSDGKMFSQIAAHNESVLRKQGVIK